MKNKKRGIILILILNILGVICLFYYAIPYIMHNTIVRNPDAMLPVEDWDAGGMALTLGLIPLTVVNLLGFIFVNSKKNLARILWFVPSIVCLILVISYWI